MLTKLSTWFWWASSFYVLFMYHLSNGTSVPELPLPLMFMDQQDVYDVYGILTSRINRLEPSETFLSPPLKYKKGAIVFGAFPCLDGKGYEIYASNTTGNEPRISSKPFNVNVLRYITKDFQTYSMPHVALTFLSKGDPYPFSNTVLKSMARSSSTNETILVVLGLKGINIYKSIDGGLSFVPTIPSLEPNFIDKDDINVMFNRIQNHFVDMQITKQNWTLKYCDNLKGCNHRRVVSARNSSDGVKWSDDLGLITPDSLDPPELQFYRIRPFYISEGTSAVLMAHVLLYAPGPSILGSKYGRQPQMCAKAPNQTHCHAPHLYSELWIGPKTGIPEDLKGWRRPHRSTPVAPQDAFLMAPSLLYGDVHVWVDSGMVYILPKYRMCGLYTPANGEFSTAFFKVPSDPLLMNADAKWGKSLITGGCDEGCAAYVMVEAINEAGQVIKGFEKEKCIMMNFDSLRKPLIFDGKNTTSLAGERIQLRIYFRDAIVYSISVE